MDGLVQVIAGLRELAEVLHGDASHGQRHVRVEDGEGVVQRGVIAHLVVEQRGTRRIEHQATEEVVPALRGGISRRARQGREV